MKWLLIIINVSGGHPVVIEVDSEKACRTAAAEIKAQNGASVGIWPFCITPEEP